MFETLAISLFVLGIEFCVSDFPPQGRNPLLQAEAPPTCGALTRGRPGITVKVDFWALRLPPARTDFARLIKP